MAKRMRLTSEKGETWARVTIEYHDTWEDRRVTRHFRVSTMHATLPGETRYVHEGDGQVCERLAHRSDTLTASPETLASVIRREYRSMRRAEARELRPRW